MRTVSLSLASLLACGCVSTGSTIADAPQELTLERILSQPSLTGTPPARPVWAPDSQRLAFLWNDTTTPRREIWLVDATGSQPKRLDGTAGARDLAWLPDSSGLIYLRAQELWRTGLDGQGTRITTFSGGASTLALAPNGQHASVLQNGDLWLVNLSTGELRQLTKVSIPSISKVPVGRYRRRDVEIGTYVWGGPTYAWSPDSATIAVHHVDRRKVRRVPFPQYLGQETDPNFVRRGYPGDANEKRTVGLLQVATGKLEFLNLPDPTANRVASFSWSADGRLLIDRESDTAVDRWLHVWEPSTGNLRELWHDKRDSRIYTSVGAAWHPGGKHVIVLSDASDRYGLYALSLEKPEPRRLTNPAFDVTGSPILTADGSIFYPANDPHPHEQHVFRTTLDNPTPTRLTRLSGTARPYPSPDGQHVALLHSSDQTPTELYLVRSAGGTERRITRSPPPEFHQHPWAAASYVTVPSRVDDAKLRARILRPAVLEPGKRYPVLFGPVYSNTVRNRWAGFYGTFQQLLVRMGYIVVQVDVRGSTGYGRNFREQFLMNFAGRDLEDLASAVRYLEAQPYVDPDRIGIWGSSYGGTLTVYALLKKPGLFDAGVACAAAVDPRFFGSDDVAIVRRPKTHPEAFLRGAAQYAANLEDPLLLIHGMQDQVVPFKTVVDLAEELIRKGKDFDFAFAPSGTHGWTRPRHYARYLLGKLIAHFDRHLRGRRP